MTLFQTIVVPTDFSPHAVNALALAIELAKTQDAALYLVHVYSLYRYTVLPDGLGMHDPHLRERLRGDLSQQLAASKELVVSAGVTRVETKLFEGHPAPEIVGLAEVLPAQLIVMGTHGRTGLAHVLFGSVAERVVRSACCPVITVPLRATKK